MVLKSINPSGKILYVIGFSIFVFGVIFNKTFGLSDTPEFLATTSLPLILAGAILLISSNFLKKRRKS